MYNFSYLCIQNTNNILIKKLLLSGFLIASLNGFSQAPVPFNCQNCSKQSFYQVHSFPNPTGSSISQIDIINNIYDPLQNSPGNIFLNAIGMNPADNLAYGIRWNSNELVRVDAQGNIVNLGSVTNLPTGLYDSGDFGSDGYLHVRLDQGQTMYRIDVQNLTVVSSYIFSSIIEPGDFALSIVDGLFYSVDPNGVLFTIDPSNGTVNTIGSSGIVGSYGAVFSDATGRIWAIHNETGILYQFNKVNGIASASTFLTIATLNDGFSCRNVISSFEFNMVTQVNEITIQADVADVQYNWVDCNNNFQSVLGETNQSFVATSNGDYAVIVNQNGCVDTSDCITINSVGINELIQSEKELIKIIDFLGRETEFKAKIPLIFIYNDGTRQRVMKLEE
jgi:hypothetical protein